MEVRVTIKSFEDKSYTIYIRSGIRARLEDYIAHMASGRSVFCIWDERVYRKWGESCLKQFHTITWQAEEPSKRLSAIEFLAGKLLEMGADRSSLLVAVGGGVTGDVVGFLASIFMRGITVVQVPTTLVAQVDSSIGGKTGVDLQEGKNLLGSFHQPAAVYSDPEFLTTLEDSIFCQGMAEVIKTAWIGDAELIDFIENNMANIKNRRSDALEEVIFRCARVKAQVVMADEKEGNLRRILNFGHTFGHALEQLSGFTLPHGEAVGIGMRCALILGTLLGRTFHEDVYRLENLLRAFNLPTNIPANFSTEEILKAFFSDKKKKAGELTFVIADKPGKTSFFSTRDLEIVAEAIEKARE